MLFTAAGLVTGNWSRVFGLLIVIFCLITPHLPSRQIPAKKQFPIPIDREIRRSEAFEVSFDRPLLSNKKAEKRLNAWISEIVDDFSAESSANAPPDSEPKTLEGRITRHVSRHPFLSLKFDIAEFVEGAHHNTYIETFVFDMKTGHCLSLTDLFTLPGKALESISTTAVRQLETTSVHGLSARARERLQPAEQNFQHFNLDQNGITFFFPVYQAGSRALDERRVTIPYAGLNQWMAPGIKDKL
ncbi:MAG: hypothetical protein JEZ12_04950 [Desulfobacterium sp.]|nr:hypothetical protein [Desulfobacterium sp.]